LGSQKKVACIAHKSLEIFERCRLWQQHHPATPDDVAAFGKKNLKTVCFALFTLNHALKQTRRRLFKRFLARNELVDSHQRVIFAG